MVSKCALNFVVKTSCYDIILLTLKHSHHFNFCLEFHDPFLLCSDGFTLINLKLSCYDHVIFSFSSCYYMKLYSSFFPICGLFICFSHISLRLSPSLLLDPTQSLPVHLTHCVYLDFLSDDPCIFVAYSYSSAVPIEPVTIFLFEA